MKMIVCKGCGTKMEAVDQHGKPACPICCGISPDSSIPIEVEAPDVAKCSFCGKEAIVSERLAFYDSRDNTYYCGCRGWD